MVGACCRNEGIVDPSSWGAVASGATIPTPMKTNKRPTGLLVTVVVATAVATVVAAGWASQASAHGGKHGKQGHENLKILPRDIGDAELTRTMNDMGGALGVSCEHCHTSRFADDDTPAKARAREMMTMVKRINTGYLARAPVTCWTCHRGNATPPEFGTP